MVKLPEDFLNRMRCQLGDEYESFLACYRQESCGGLRVNTEKVSVEEFLSLTPFHLTPVPWTKNGFYYEKDEPVTRHPHYFAGLYYIQEPSAMLPASRLPVMNGDMVLDLCAAPGGKATELSSLLGGTGLLVANDASASRAKALVKNLTVWGSTNCCITGETPEALLASFGCFFDKILVDAPCSGEGMFRKDSGLIKAWEERGPAWYADIQKDILDCAVRMLKPGGMLVYSTCTFSEEEDEQVISAMLERYPALSLMQPDTVPGFEHGRSPCEKTVRLWPHRIAGEGHFLALIKKESGGEESKCTAECRYTESEIRKSHRQIPDEVREFLTLIPENLWKDCMYVQKGEQCFLMPPYRIPGKLRYLKTGIQAGTFKKGRFEPSQALAMALNAGTFQRTVNLSSKEDRVIRYLKGETLELTEKECSALESSGKGWVLICTDGFALGWGKYVNGCIRNKLYPGWRLN